jgi:hypothetical protein
MSRIVRGTALAVMSTAWTNSDLFSGAVSGCQEAAILRARSSPARPNCSTAEPAWCVDRECPPQPGLSLSRRFDGPLLHERPHARRVDVIDAVSEASAFVPGEDRLLGDDSTAEGQPAHGPDAVRRIAVVAGSLVPSQTIAANPPDDRRAPRRPGYVGTAPVGSFPADG